MVRDNDLLRSLLLLIEKHGQAYDQAFHGFIR